MGIEPKRAAHQSLENAAFNEPWIAACDWRANFRVMRGNVGLRETTHPFAIEFPLSDPKPRYELRVTIIEFCESGHQPVG
jgi:hypothetical protein